MAFLVPLFLNGVAFADNESGAPSKCASKQEDSLMRTSHDVLAFVERPVVERPMKDSLQTYKEHASAISQRSLMALISKPQKQRVYELYEKSNNFQDLDKLSDEELQELELKYSRKSSHDCYKFVKASVSGDYDTLRQRVKMSADAPWNSSFLNKNKDDIVDAGLVESYWGGRLRKRWR